MVLGEAAGPGTPVSWQGGEPTATHSALGTAAPASVGVIHGRFQPLHLGHLEYLLAGKRVCETLVVGITNPDPEVIAFEATNPDRSRPDANPWTFYERYLMVEAALVENGVPRSQFRIVPFPHSHPQRLCHYAPPEALYLLTIYDEWGETKLARFEELGLTTHVLWRRSAKVTSGSEIRRRIAHDEGWDALVPPAVAAVIRGCASDQRIREAHV
jgi:cytidyltransferase-like protein